MSYPNIPPDSSFFNGIEELAPGEFRTFLNPSNYQPTFQHSKWKPTMKNKFSIIELVADLPKPVARFLAEVDLNLPRASNIANIGSPKSSSKRSVAFKHLRNMKILKRAGKNKFMISPVFRIPPGGRVHVEVDMWNSLSPTDETITAPPMRKKPPTK